MPDETEDLFDLDEGRKARDEGIQRVSGVNYDPHAAWRDHAKAWVTSRARDPGEFGADDLRKDVGAPMKGNAMGAIWMWAVKTGVVIRTGDRLSAVKSNHAHRQGLYEGVGHA